MKIVNNFSKIVAKILSKPNKIAYIYSINKNN